MEIMDLKKKIYSSVDSHRERIIEIGRTIYANPETGHRNTGQVLLSKENLAK